MAGGGPDKYLESKYPTKDRMFPLSTSSVHCVVLLAGEKARICQLAQRFISRRFQAPMSRFRKARGFFACQANILRCLGSGPSGHPAVSLVVALRFWAELHIGAGRDVDLG